MKNDIYDYLKFKLDSEFADYEFDIIPVPPYELIENELSFELYEYFGKITEIFGVRTKHIFLYFNADVLMRVELLFTGDLLKYLKIQLENMVDIEIPEYLMLILRKDKEFTVLRYQTKILQKQT